MKKFIVIGLSLAAVLFFSQKTVHAFGECDQYGYMVTYDSFSNTCSCMSGYSFSTDMFGEKKCISDMQICKDKYGYNATSDYSGSCKCNYGYSFSKNSIGKTQCIDTDSICHDQLGLFSSYESYSDSCVCDSGYIIDRGECVNANRYCSNNLGYHSSYDRSSKKCTCDTGYTIDDSGECVEKQNNAYFFLEELDTDNNRAIIKSQYDYNYYSIEYGIGCYSFTLNRYEGKLIVVNLGTDFDLDLWDKIVLQDESQTCNITLVEEVDSDFTFENSEEDNYVATPTYYVVKEDVPVKKVIETTPPVPTRPKQVTIPKPAEQKKEVATGSIDQVVISGLTATSEVDMSEADESKLAIKLPWYRRLFNWFRGE